MCNPYFELSSMNYLYSIFTAWHNVGMHISYPMDCWEFTIVVVNYSGDSWNHLGKWLSHFIRRGVACSALPPFIESFVFFSLTTRWFLIGWGGRRRAVRSQSPPCQIREHHHSFFIVLEVWVVHKVTVISSPYKLTKRSWTYSVLPIRHTNTLFSNKYHRPRSR